MLSSHQRVAANPPNLLARNRAPLGDSRGAFLLQGCQGEGEVIKTPQTQFSGSFPCSRFKLHLRILEPVKPDNDRLAGPSRSELYR